MVERRDVKERGRHGGRNPQLLARTLLLPADADQLAGVA
jgi:hypothetical protein